LLVDIESLAATATGLAAWLSSGACQELSGAFVAWVDVAKGRRAFEYPEITGYALTFLAGRAVLSEHETIAGHRAAGWLDERIRSGNFAARDDWDGGAVYLFDLGIVASGLLAFGHRTGTERYVDTGLRVVDFLDRELSSGDPIEPVSRTGPASGREASWSNRGRPHLAKLVQTFFLAEELGGGDGRPPSARLVEAARDEQVEAMLHPALYAAEGLWLWGTAAGDVGALERAAAALDWIWTHQLEHGGLPREAGSPVEQSDVTAQAVRLSVALGARSAAVDRALERLMEIAVRDARGVGIPYQPGSDALHVNTWVTLFAAQAFELAGSNGRPVRWQDWV
jgi:hypothetical protein